MIITRYIHCPFSLSVFLCSCQTSVDYLGAIVYLD